MVYLGRGENGEGRFDKSYRFEQDNQSALDGGVVWAKLKELGKAVDPDEFNAKALLGEGEDGSERLMTKPSEIGVGSSSLRLAKPAAAVQTDEQPAAGAGVTVPPPEGTSGYAVGKEVQLKLSLTVNLEAGDRRDQIFKLLDEVAAAVDRGEASHIQLSMNLVVPEQKADALVSRAEVAGATSSKTALD